MKKLIAILLLFSSCTLQKKMTTGPYVIKSVKNNVVQFYRVHGRYYIPCDTLKVNDTIVINVIKILN